MIQYDWGIIYVIRWFKSAIRLGYWYVIGWFKSAINDKIWMGY